MGLSDQLSAINSKAEEFPAAHSGFNADNLGSLPSAPALTDHDLFLLQQRRANIQSLDIASPPPYDESMSSSNSSSSNSNDNNNNRSQHGHLVAPVGKPAADSVERTLIAGLIADKIWRIVKLNKLEHFFTTEQLQATVDRACKHDYMQLKTQFELPDIDSATDLAVLSLYDIVILGDDSGSMDTYESGERNKRVAIMQEVCGTVAYFATLFDDDGISVRFLNSSAEGNNLTSPKQVRKLFNSVKMSGGTPLGAKLKSRIIAPFLQKKIKQNELAKPLLVIILTDGIPDSEDEVKSAILSSKEAAKQTKYNEHAIAYSFAQIGSDGSATRFLNALDVDAQVGHMVDVTSSFEAEKRQVGGNFTAQTWIIKLLVGAVDPSYDKSDEEGLQQQPSESSGNRVGAAAQGRNSNMLLFIALIVLLVALHFVGGGSANFTRRK